MQEKGLLGRSSNAVAYNIKDKQSRKEMDDRRSTYSAVYRDVDETTSFFEASDPAKVF